MIPTCLNLTPEQRARVVAFRESLPKLTLEEHDAEFGGVTITSDVTFHVYATGIGDVLIATCQGKKCDLSLDDGGELV